MKKESILTYILAACALVIVGLVIGKEFFLETHSVPQPIRHIGNLDTLNIDGIQAGTEDAEVTIIEFFDYECPYCKKFQESVDYIYKE